MYTIEENMYSKDTGRYGKSLFAKKDFKKDDVVFVAYGPLIKHATLYTIPVSKDLKIDPTKPEGNLCQYICHSCDPNLGIRNRSCFVAFKDIKKDEEIRIDYAMIGDKYGDEITAEERICKCGSAICRGKMGCYNELPEEIKKKYEGYVSEWLIGR